MSPELARAIDALVAVLDALEGRVGTDELLPRAVVDEARAAYDALARAMWDRARRFMQRPAGAEFIRHYGLRTPADGESQIRGAWFSKSALSRTARPFFDGATLLAETSKSTANQSADGEERQSQHSR